MIENSDDVTYPVAVTGALDDNDIELQQSATYAVVRPTRRRLVDLPEGDEPLTLEFGAPITLRWSVPVEHTMIEVSPPVQTPWERTP